MRPTRGVCVRGVRRWSWLFGVVVLVATACGSRLTTEEIRAQSAVRGEGSGFSAGDATAGGDDAGATADGGTATTLASAGAGATGRTKTGPGASGAAATAGSKAPIVVGLVGSFSGIAGPPSRPVADIWVAWSKMINARGGINGHKVQLLIGDDGTNAARSISIAQDFVENKKAIALSFMGPDTVAFLSLIHI